MWRYVPPLFRSPLLREALARIPTTCEVPCLGFVVCPGHHLLKRRNSVQFTPRFDRNLDLYQSGRMGFGEQDASVQGWINHVRFADTWGLRQHVCDSHPFKFSR